jgi:hypothetical protein
MGVKKMQHEDFDPQEAAQALQRIQDDFSSAAASESRVLCSTSGSPSAAVDEPCEPSSPVCYAKEFKDWQPAAQGESQ